jgi:prevent-host-death family protein
MGHEVPVTQARAEFADLVNRVVYGGERIVVTRHGKPIAALVSAADLDLLERLADAPADNIIPLAPGRIERSQPAHERRLDIAAQHQAPYDTTVGGSDRNQTTKGP